MCFGLFKRKERQPPCKHEWHYLKHHNIFNNYLYSFDDGCWIICVKCEEEKLVYEEEWDKIKRRQEILKEFKDNY